MLQHKFHVRRAHTAYIIRNSIQFLLFIAEKLVKQAENADGYDISAIKDTDKVIKNEAIREILKTNGASDIIREHIWAVAHIMEKGGSADLGGLRVNVDRNQMTFGIIEEAEDFEFVIPENRLLVLGDNRNESLDSRFFGLVKKEDILGKVYFRILPINGIRFF